MEIELGLEIAVADNASQEFVGQWARLVSTTNWEKGRIIHEWRQALVEAGASATQYSDEAWSRRVAHVSGQHVGRLRRVFERFGDSRDTYTGLYWSHFQAALDWGDAEMWLEGAVQNDWSISEMRGQRHEALGGGVDKDVLEAATDGELDEDFQPIEGATLREVQNPGKNTGSMRDDFDGGDSDRSAMSSRADDDMGDMPVVEAFDADEAMMEATPSAARERGTFEDLADVPEDLSEALESLKLVVLRHKSTGWQDVSRNTVVAWLDAIKELTLSPS